MNCGTDRLHCSRAFIIFAATAIVAAAVCAAALAADDDDAKPTSGTCGEYATWTIDSEGNLRIENGCVRDFEPSDTEKWGGNTVRTVSFGYDVNYVGAYAFYGCKDLVSVDLGTDAKIIGKYAFYNCSSLERIYSENMHLDTVYEYGFAYCGIKSFDVKRIMYLYEGAFLGCSSLKSVTHGYGLMEIAPDAFNRCTSLESINVTNYSNHFISEDGILFTKDKKTLVRYPEAKEGSEYAVPEYVTSIAESAFAYCTNLEHIWLRDSVKSIGAGAFEGCRSLQAVSMCDSVKTIGERAFANCASLKTVMLPISLTTISENLFHGCTSMKRLTIYHSVTSIGDNAFSECTSLEVMNIPDSVTSIGNNAFRGCASLRSVDISDSVTSIGSNAFAKCASLTSFKIPQWIKEIKYGTFAGCASLQSIKIPDRVVSIENCAFEGCHSLLSISFGNGKPALENAFPDHAFYGKGLWTSLDKTAEDIGGHTFVGDSTYWMEMQDP